MADADALRAAYDEQLRGHVPDRLPSGMRAERDGPLVRSVGSRRGGMIVYRDLGGLEGAGLDELIRRQVRVFDQRGESFEWKTHAHDLPRDLPERLRAAGFVPEPPETVLAASVGEIAREPAPPLGVVVREVTDTHGLARIAALETHVWQQDHSWLAPTLGAWRALDPDGVRAVVAEARGELVCAAWLRVARGTAFARLHGGATLAEWRGRGVYRALVAYRAGLAAGIGCDYLQVDASAASRPILERLGFSAIASTQPFRWTPSG